MYITPGLLRRCAARNDSRATDGRCPTAMRIAQIIAGAPAGGAELFFERLTLALARSGDVVLPIIRRDAARAD
ncbi:MAG TPA: hypothetical protein VFW75_07355, partial [Acetobacteraceae bacterium]|nr:hypothetical protein [Acetobacteraceae bacterium]